MSSDCEDFVDAPEAISEEVVANGGGGGSGGRPRPKALEWSMETTMPQIALFPATPKAVSPANGKPEPVASRRGRLSILRSRMHSEFGSEISDGSASESTSLASWGRNLLFEHKFDCSRSEGGFPRVAYANDSVSTKAAFSPLSSSPPSLPPPPRSAPPLSTMSSNATASILSQPAIVVKQPPPAAIQRVESNPRSDSNRSSTSYSSAASSKSSTLDRTAVIADNSLTPASTAHHAKSNSLDRGMSLKTIRAGPFPPHHSKTNSLSREFSTSFSSCDPPSYLVLDDSESQRNEEAVEIINEITSDVLHGVGVRDDNKSSSRSDDVTNVSRTGRLSVVEERASPEHQESSSRPQSSANGSIIEENGNSMTGSATAPAGAPGVVHPVKPPRRKKTSDANESSTLSPLPMERQEMLTPDANIINNSIFNNNINNSPGLLPSSPISPEYFATLETPYREPYKESSSATLPLTQEDWRVLEPVSMRNLDAGENAPSLRHLDRSGSIDPITKDIGRRMSLKQHHSLKRDGSAPSGSSVPSDDTSSTHSFETDAMSTMSSTSRLGHAFTAIRGNVRAMSKVMKGVYVKAKNVTATTPSKLDDLRDGASSNETEEEENDVNESTGIVRPKNAKKGPFDFDQLRQVQDLSGEHTGAVWCVKFSLCGRLLATAGQDNMVRVWVLRNHYEYFNTMRERYNLETKRVGTLNDGLLQKTMDELEQATQLMTDTTPREQREETASTSSERSSSTADDIWAPFAAKPFCTYRGHTADVLDLSWSKNYFILSSGMDRTVRLWHVSRPECLCCFQHMDFVTSIAFLPKDDRYFLSGSLDGKLRLWHIPDKKVALWNEVEQAKLITAMTFVKNGKFAVVGTYNGRCIFFSTDQLKYHTMIDVRSTRGKNSRGHKVTGLAVHGDKLLVTSNDSRVRMYDLRDMALTCKYKGASNERSQIRASFSPDGRHIICGSEDRYVYLWRTVIDAKESLAATLSVRKDRNAMWERIRGHTAVVTAAIFAPKPQLIFAQIENMKRSSAADLFATTPMTGGAKSATTPKGKTIAGDVIVSADLSGTVKVFINRTRIKTGSSVFFPTD